MCIEKNKEIKNYYDMKFFIIGTNKENFLNYYYIDKQMTSKENIYKIVEKFINEGV